MLQARRGARLVEEPIGHVRRRGERSAQELDGDLFAERRVLGFEHRAHPSLPEHPRDDEVADATPNELGNVVRHRRSRPLLHRAALVLHVPPPFMLREVPVEVEGETTMMPRAS